MEEDVIYDSYDPLVLQQAAGQEMRRFESFDAALDEFYSKVRPLTLSLGAALVRAPLQGAPMNEVLELNHHIFCH